MKFSGLVVVGSRFLVRRPRSLRAGYSGLSFIPSDMDQCGDIWLFAAFCHFAQQVLFAVFAADSALPFTCCCPGLLVPCSIFHSFAKWRNAAEVSCEPLSLQRCPVCRVWQNGSLISL